MKGKVTPVKKAARRITAALMSIAFVAGGCPQPASAAPPTAFMKLPKMQIPHHTAKPTSTKPASVPKPPPPAMPPKPIVTGPNRPNLFPPTLSLSASPTDLEISSARIFREPLVPLHIAPVDGENAALAKAVLAYRAKKDHEDISDLTGFISQYPQSRYRAALEMNLGTLRFESGYFSDALKYWNSAWEAARGETEPQQKAVADEAVSQMVLLEARLGRKDELAKNLDELKTRTILGSCEQRLKAASDGLQCMNKRADISYRCGVFGLNGLYNAIKGTKGPNKLLAKEKSTNQGTNLAHLKKLADEVGLNVQLAKRNKGAAIVVPSLVHFKVDHFASIVSEHQGRYHVADATFDRAGSMFVSKNALDAETDGYFLIPAGPLPAGWESLSEAAAENVWGKGNAATHGPPAQGQPLQGIGGIGGGGNGFGNGGPPPGPPPPCRKTSCEECNRRMGCKGMAVADAYSMQASLNIKDVPIGYQPPKGPSIHFLINYNHQEAGQPSTFTFTNLGPDWSINWCSSMTFDASSNATVLTAGGGSTYFAYPYTPDLYTQANLVSMGSGVYEIQHPNGSYEKYALTDSSGRVYMTQVTDQQGLSATIQYDAHYRISSVTDALSQVSTFTYGSNTVGAAGYYVLTKITDAFSRSATFSYDSTYTQLLQITDVIGLTSKFTYLSGTSFINSMTTPYGCTGFMTFTPAGQPSNLAQGLTFSFPDGTQAVIANVWGTDDSTYYWNREAMQLNPGDPYRAGATSNATIINWMLQGPLSAQVESAVPVFVSSPASLTYRPNTITYTYAGQTSDGDHFIVGPSNQPTNVAQGFTNQYTYNSQNNITSTVDGIGRTVTYSYASNGIDLTQATETRGGDNYIMGQWSNYNSLHEPQTYKDGSGQSTLYTYNSAGQLQTIKDANLNTTTLTYNTNGYLTKVQGPLAGSSDITTMSYDGYGRVYQVTDSEGYVLTYSYDNMDRVIKVTYPDGTTDSAIYDRLDPILVTDRDGRCTQSAYDSMDQLIYQVDPLGRETQYMWCACGSLHMLTDPNGNMTTWQRDILGRVLTKIYPDQTSVKYAYDTGPGLILSVTDAMGQTKTYTRNNEEEITNITYTNSVNPTSNVTIGWDNNFKRVTSVQNGWGTISYGYNPYVTTTTGTTTGGGMLSSVTNNVIANSAIGYSYDVLGRVTQRQINGSANSVNWSYDAISRITQEVNALGTFNYTYVDDDAGYSKGTSRLSSISYPNGQKTFFNWFGNLKDQRLQGINNLKSDGTALSNFSYKYDPAGQITLWQQQQGANFNKTYTLSYDLAGQLISAQSGSMSVVGKPFGDQYFYNYDPGSNRTSAQQSNVQACLFAGSVTAGDVITVTVKNSALSGGQEQVSYVLQSGDALIDMNNNIAGAICADTALQSAGINAYGWNETFFLNATSASPTTFTVSFNTGATETVTYGMPIAANIVGEPENTYQLMNTVGTPTVGDVMSITVHDPGLTGGVKTVSYTVQSGDNAGNINYGLMSAINADSSLAGLNITATLYQSVLVIISYSPNTTTYTTAHNDGATESMELDLVPNPFMNVLVGGSVHAGDQLTLTAYDPSLTGGSRSVTYTVLSTDTLPSIAQGIATTIQNDSVLPFLMYAYAYTGDARVFMRSLSPSLTTYRATVSSGATETLGIGYSNNGVQTASLAGTITVGNQITMTVIDPALSGGQKSVSYTIQSGDDAASAIANLANALNSDTSLQALPLQCWWGGPTMFMQSSSVNATNYSASVSTGGTETLTLGPGQAGTTKYAYNTVNELVSTTGGGQVSFQGTTNKPIKSASVATQVVNISATQPVTTYGSYVTQFGSETLTLGQNQYGNIKATVGGTIIVGDVVQINVFNSALAGGEVKVPHAVVSGDTTTAIATALASTINSTSALTSLGMSATSSGAVVTITIAGTTYTTSTSGGATETLTMGPNNSGNVSVTVGGKITSGNTLTITTHNASLSGGVSNASYTTVSTDTLATAATGLANAINSNGAMTALGLSAGSTAIASLPDSETFSANPNLASGINATTISATDGGNNSKTNSYPISVKGGNAATLAYDLNGNMTSDGTNTYSWDAENRLIKITYPGSGNNTTFSYSGLGLRSTIIETTAGSATSTKQFIWSAGNQCEIRDSSGSVVVQNFGLGDNVGGTGYFYTLDHLSSVHEMTSSVQAIQGQFSYDPYGRVRQIQGSGAPTFQYAGYYYHSPSGLSLTATRPYSSSFGRFIERDSIEESGGTNLYAYVGNVPSVYRDPEGKFGPLVEAFLTWLEQQSVAVESELPILEEDVIALVRQAQQEYPRLACKCDQLHHLVEQRIGMGAGPLVKIPAAYHQLITNAFEKAFPRGTKSCPTDAELLKILQDVYSRFPLKGFQWFPGTPSPTSTPPTP